MDGKAEGRWLGTSPCDKRTIELRTNALRAFEGKSSELIPPGPRSRVGTDPRKAYLCYFRSRTYRSMFFTRYACFSKADKLLLVVGDRTARAFHSA